MSLYILLPLLSALCTFFLAFFVLFKNFRRQLNRAFFLFAFSITIWLGGTAILMGSCADSAKAIFWDRFIYFGVIFIPPTYFHFTKIFAKIKNQTSLLFAGYITSFIFFMTSRTDLFVHDLTEYSWGCHTTAGTLHNIFLAYFTLFIILGFRNLFSRLKRTNGIEKKRVKFVLTASVLMGAGIVGFFPAYGINLYPFGYLGGLGAVVVLTYAMVKHHLLNTKAIATEIFSVGISMLILIDAVLSKTRAELAWKSTLFIFVLVLNILIIRGLLQEIRAKNEIAKISKDLKIANVYLRRLDKTKSEFLSIASHQLRSPITAIKGYSSLILEGEFGKTNKKIKTVVEKIFHSSERIALMINDFLDISRIETGKMHYEFAEFDLKKMVSDIINDLKTNNSKAKKLEITLSPKEDTEFLIKADQNKINQVVTNIIDNSLKYTSEGFIRVSLSENKQKNTVLIKVADSGIGIARKEVYRIFGKFTRAEDVSRYYTDGSGLGLYVARKIIQAHRGKIWADSAGEGKGSIFFVELPVS